MDDKIVPKAVTEKTVKNLNLNFKFLFNVKFGPWAFRNCAYFVTKPTTTDGVRHSKAARVALTCALRKEKAAGFDVKEIQI